MTNLRFFRELRVLSPPRPSPRLAANLGRRPSPSAYTVGGALREASALNAQPQKWVDLSAADPPEEVAVINQPPIGPEP